MKWLVGLLAWPLLAQQAAPSSSVEKERALGSTLARDVRRQSRLLDEPSVDAYVQRIGDALVASLPASPTVYHFEVILSDAAEPVAFPGGFILIPATALLNAKNESELAGMLAHGIGHIALRHGIMPDTLQTPGPLIYVGNGSGLHQESRSNNAPVPLALVARQRQNEKEADRFAAELMNRTRFHPAPGAMEDAEFQRIQAAVRAALPARRSSVPTLVR